MKKNLRWTHVKLQVGLLGIIVVGLLAIAGIKLIPSWSARMANRAIVSPSPEPVAFVPTKTENNEIADLEAGSKPGWKKYVAKKAAFTIEYPEQLLVHENFYPEGNYGGMPQGSVTFCASTIDAQVNHCNNQVNIIYGVPEGDGWGGGGCEPEMKTQITLLGKKQTICAVLDPMRGSGALYGMMYRHPQNVSEVNLIVSADATTPLFSLELGQEMLKTFVFTTAQ